MDVLTIALFPYIVHYVRKSVVFLCSCSVGQVHVIIRGIICVGVGGIVWPLGALVGAYYGWWGFKSVSKILLGETVESSFMWLSFV